jgi:shikimate dehydrogenase
VAHSLSPVLHGAAYAALGLSGWTYERRECTAEDLPGLVDGLDGAWVGLSVTMPGKKAALAYATTASTRARRLGVANTLVRTDAGWAADCTDVDGIAGALRAAGIVEPAPLAAGLHDVVVLGAGATASAAVGALSVIGNEDVQLVVRSPARAAETTAVVEAYGMRGLVRTFDRLDEVDLSRARAVVNTTPAGAVDAATADRLLAGVPDHAVVLDAVYHPWPTPLAAAAARRGLAVATGLDMLLHQAFGQVEQFTGRSAPRREMHRALVRATGFDVRPP